MVDVKSLIDEVTCDICCEVPQGRVFQCHNGHPICDGCVNVNQQLKICPQCRLLYGAKKIRCRLMENLLENVKVTCPFKGSGCTDYLSLRDYNDHEQMCYYRAEKSVNLCKDMGFNQCTFSTSSGPALASHLATYHGALNWNAIMWTQFITQYLQSKNSINATYLHNFQDSPVQFATYVALTFPPEGATFSCVALYLGDYPQQTSNYVVTLKLTTSEKKEISTWVGSPVFFKGDVIKEKALRISAKDIIDKTDSLVDFNLLLTIFISPKNLS